MKDFIAYDRFKQKMEIGCNIRLPELQALMIYSVVKEYKEIIKNKFKIAAKYIEVCNSLKIKYISQNKNSNLGNYYKFTIISPDKIISDFLPKIKTTTSKVYDYSLGTSKEIPLKHLCLPIWFGLEENISDKVIEEIKQCVEKFGIKEISFWDDTMSYHRKWMKEFLNLLIEENLDLCWSCYAAVNTVDKEILKLMKKAGCWNIFYGYETAIDTLANNIQTNRKNRDFEKMKQVAKWTKEAGIEVRGSFLIGLPGETPELAKKTVQNAIDLDPDYAQFTLVCPYKGNQNICRTVKYSFNI